MKIKILVGLLIVALLSCGCVQEPQQHIETNILVIDKTSETIPTGFGSTTDYLILGNNSIVYHAAEWKTYQSIKVNRTYCIKAKNLRGYGHSSNYWEIYSVTEIGEEERNV